MKELTEKQKKEIMNTPPKGTWIILATYGILFAASWLYLWFFVFVAHGPVK